MTRQLDVLVSRLDLRASGGHNPGMLHCSKNCSIRSNTQSRPIKEGNMEANTKSTKTEAKTIEATFCPAACASLFNKGLKRVVEASKTSLDLAIEQNSEVLGSYKKALKASSMPGLFLFDLVEQVSEGYVSLQKSLLDLAVEQSSAVVEAAHECIQDPNLSQAGISHLIEQSVDRMVTAQNSALEFAAHQTKVVSDTVKKQPEVAGTPAETVADSVQRGFETVVTAQKEILNNAGKASKNTVAKAK